MNNEKSIFLLQEPALIRGELRKYPKGYIMYGVNKNCRATIVAPKSYNIWFEPELSDKDICVCSIIVDKKRFLLASIYLDILLPVINERLRVLANKIMLENIPIIIGADTNAWSKLWMASWIFL